jgi:acetyl-CoA synthetase
MRIFEKYAQADFTSYEDFKENFKITVPEGFNFAYDVLDELAATKPEKTALYWTNDQGAKRVISFAEMKRLSDKAANYLSSLGIGKGDMVMIILKRDWQFWFTIMALHKLGAVTIPATHLLTEKDITYRVNAAGVKAIICTGAGEIAAHIDNAKDVPTLEYKLLCGERGGWLNYD